MQSNSFCVSFQPPDNAMGLFDLRGEVFQELVFQTELLA
jgi:hypothetical protein